MRFSIRVAFPETQTYVLFLNQSQGSSVANLFTSSGCVDVDFIPRAICKPFRFQFINQSEILIFDDVVMFVKNKQTLNLCFNDS